MQYRMNTLSLLVQVSNCKELVTYTHKKSRRLWTTRIPENKYLHNLIIMVAALLLVYKCRSLARAFQGVAESPFNVPDACISDLLLMVLALIKMKNP